MKDLRSVLIDCYLDRINNYLTTEKFAEHNGLKAKQAEALIDVCRSVFMSNHPES